MFGRRSGVPIAVVLVVEFVEQHGHMAPRQLANSLLANCIPPPVLAICRNYFRLVRVNPCISGRLIEDRRRACRSPSYPSLRLPDGARLRARARRTEPSTGNLFGAATVPCGIAGPSGCPLSSDPGDRGNAECVGDNWAGIRGCAGGEGTLLPAWNRTACRVPTTASGRMVRVE